MLLAAVLMGIGYGLYQWGDSGGYKRAGLEGSKALSGLQSKFDTYRRTQAEQENAALKAWAERYQAQVIAGQQAVAEHLSQVADLESQNNQLRKNLNDVTQRWTDEKGKSHPIKCVFTRGFVQRYNAALGFSNDTDGSQHGNDTGSVTSAGSTSRRHDTADARLRDSGVSQQDVLANIIDNALQCRVWRSQVNSLLDEREGLQK